MGSAADAPLAGRPDVDALPLDASVGDDELGHHPQIAVLEKEEAMATAESRLARVGKSPDWSVELSYSQRGPAYSNMVSVMVSMPISAPSMRPRFMAAMNSGSSATSIVICVQKCMSGGSSVASR